MKECPNFVALAVTRGNDYENKLNAFIGGFQQFQLQDLTNNYKPGYKPCGLL